MYLGLAYYWGMKAFNTPWHFSLSLISGSAHNPSTGEGFELGKGRVRSMEGNRHGFEIDCDEGLVWLTQENGGSDVLLRRGESFRVTRPGRVVIEALENAMVRKVDGN